MTDQQQRLHRIDRLVDVRNSYVTAAEARVREAEHQVRVCEEVADARDRQIRQVREEIAYLDHTTGAVIQNRERYIFSLHVRARQTREALEKARKVLDGRMAEWRVTKQEHMVLEKVQERRLLEWQHSVDVTDQKNVDEMSVVRYARNQSNHQTHAHEGNRSNTTEDPE